MALHSLYCADMPLRNCSLTHPLTMASLHVAKDLAQISSDLSHKTSRTQYSVQWPPYKDAKGLAETSTQTTSPDFQFYVAFMLAFSPSWTAPWRCHSTCRPRPVERRRRCCEVLYTDTHTDYIYISLYNLNYYRIFPYSLANSSCCGSMCGCSFVVWNRVNHVVTCRCQTTVKILHLKVYQYTTAVNNIFHAENSQRVISGSCNV